MNPVTLPSSAIPIWNLIGPVDRDLCKFTSTIADAKIFDSFLHNQRLPPCITHTFPSVINWPLTQDWCKRNHTTDITSVKKTKWEIFKLKAFNHILPCGDILQKHYPLLYKHLQGKIPCLVCSSNENTNIHLGLCPQLRDSVDNILLELHSSLRDYLLASVADGISTYFLEQELIDLPLFQPVSDDTQDLYLLMHSFVPHLWWIKSTITLVILIQLMDRFFQFVYRDIWLPYLDHLKS